MAATAGQSRLVVHLVHQLEAGALEHGLFNLIRHMPPERYRHAIVCLRGSSEQHAQIRAHGRDMPDHSPPRNSATARRTMAILRQQRAMGWRTTQLTGPHPGLVEPDRNRGGRRHRAAPARGDGAWLPDGQCGTLWAAIPAPAGANPH